MAKKIVNWGYGFIGRGLNYQEVMFEAPTGAGEFIKAVYACPWRVQFITSLPGRVRVQHINRRTGQVDAYNVTRG